MSLSVKRSFAPSPRHVVVLRALQLGDLLCAVPLFRALRAAWPASEIVLIGLPWARQFVSRYAGYLDGFREFPGYPGLPEREPDVARIPEFLAAIQQERFDLAIQLHGSGSFVNSITMLLGSRRSAGFFVPGEYCPDAETFIPWPQQGLEVLRLLRLADCLGIATQGEELEFPLTSADYRKLDALPQSERLVPGQYACVHPGASTASRCWSPDNFAAVADWMAERGLTIVLTGVESERSLTATVAQAMEHPAIDLAGLTDLGSLAALVNRSALVVCNDTGISHLAAALRAPSVVTSTGDNPARWAPQNHVLHRVLCDPGGVTVAEVQAVVREQLANYRSMPARSNGDRASQRRELSNGMTSIASAGGV